MPPIHTISKQDIPLRLKNIYPSLRRLYCCGTMPDLEKYKTLVVVGARKCSDYGEKVTKHLIKGLQGYPIIIISGLAIGIDSIAHETALQYNILTIAVPGSGLEEKVLYPQRKVPLAKEIILKGGCLLSEYDSNEPMGPWVFPERNRIIAGLGDAVLIIEAEKKSGTLITARIALDYNKEIFAVPSSIFSPLSEGPHFLLQQGAVPITCSKDIIETLGLTWIESQDNEQKIIPDFAQCSEEEKDILNILPQTKDELIQLLQKPAHHIQITLSLLEIKGIIKQECGMIRLV